MRIGVIGAGAIGCIIGAFLSKSGHDVWLVDIWAEHINRIKENGLLLTHPDGQDETVSVKAVNDPARVGVCDLVLFSIKAYDTAMAARQAASMVGPNTYALTVQNGIGNVEAIVAELKMERVFYGATVLTGKMSGPGHVLLSSPIGSRVVMQIGEYGNLISAQLERVVEIFTQAGLKTEISEHPDVFLWAKLAGACTMASLDTLTRLRHGDVIDLEEGRELVALIIDEIVQVAKLKGIKLDADRLFAQIEEICHQTQHHYASMLADVLHHRRTEIDSLNGAIVREAEALGLSAPVNKTITRLVKMLEKTYDIQVTSE